MTQRTCDRCGRPNGRPLAPICKRCAKSIENAKRRGTVAPPPFEEFDCAWCAKRCVRGVDVPPHASKFCGRSCKARWHKINVEGRRRKREARRRRAEARLARAMAGEPARRLLIAGRCGFHQCRRPFVGLAVDARYCTDRCQRRAARKRYRRPDNPAYIEQRRRERRSRAERLGYQESFDVWYIGDRDGWLCGICHEPIDSTLEVPHDGAATVDHIVALARGGEHTLANVQAAHFLCNATKRDLPAVAAPART
jgi:5-methylcytosine-specific restriction endonuclease McrA